MLMILGPSSDNRIEYQDQSACRDRLVLLDDLPYLFQMSMHTFWCWFNQQDVPFSGFVLAYVLTQEEGIS